MLFHEWEQNYLSLSGWKQIDLGILRGIIPNHWLLIKPYFYVSETNYFTGLHVKEGKGFMKCRLFLGFLLVMLLGGCIGKEVTLYTIPKGVFISAPKDTLRLLFPILLNYHSK